MYYDYNYRCFVNCVRDLLDTPEVRSMRQFPHHPRTSCYEHSVCVAYVAYRLARRWGANEEYARRAAILHDCTKYWSLEEHLALCKQYGVALDEMERGAVKLLHSKTGAALARYVFGEPEEVCQAICWHTTGKADMTLLEKILYIADYMEPTRAFEGVEKLRELAYADLDAAVLLGTEMSVEEMQQRGSPIHPNTLAARDFLKGTGP